VALSQTAFAEVQFADRRAQIEATRSTGPYALKLVFDAHTKLAAMAFRIQGDEKASRVDKSGKALIANPGKAAALLHLRVALKLVQNTAELHDTIRLPLVANALFNLARVRHSCGDLEQAETLYRQSLEVQPFAEQQADAHVGLALVLRAKSSAIALMLESKQGGGSEGANNRKRKGGLAGKRGSLGGGGGGGNSLGALDHAMSEWPKLLIYDTRTEEHLRQALLHCGAVGRGGPALSSQEVLAAAAASAASAAAAAASSAGKKSKELKAAAAAAAGGGGGEGAAKKAKGGDSRPPPQRDRAKPVPTPSRVGRLRQRHRDKWKSLLVPSSSSPPAAAAAPGTSSSSSSSSSSRSSQGGRGGSGGASLPSIKKTGGGRGGGVGGSDQAGNKVDKDCGTDEGYSDNDDDSDDDSDEDNDEDDDEVVGQDEGDDSNDGGDDDDDPYSATVDGEEVTWADVARVELQSMLATKVPIPQVLLAKVSTGPQLKTWQKKK